MRKYKITDQAKIDAIIKEAQVCTLSLVDNGMPYAVPMNYGYADGVIILHSAMTGKKIDILKQNNNVCVSFYCDERLNVRHEKVACSYSMKFKSVLAFGKAVEITDFNEKVDAMNEVMKQYAGKSFTYNEPAIKGVFIMKINVEEFTAYYRGYEE